MDVVAVRAPTVAKQIPTLPVSNDALVTSSYDDLMTSVGRLSMLSSLKTRRRLSCHTLSNSLLKKMIL